MPKIKSLAAQTAAAGHTFLDRLSVVAADPSDPSPLHAAALILRRPAAVADLCRHKAEIKPNLYSAFEVCIRAAIAQNNPILMHHTTALMATLIDKRVMLASEFGPLVSLGALETYHAFSARIPRGFSPKGPVVLKNIVTGVSAQKAARTSRDQPVVMPDLLAPSALVRGRDKAFSGAAYGGYMLSLLLAVEADLSNTPLLAATFSAVSWELTRLNQKKESIDALPQLPQITQTLVRIAASGLEMKKPLAVHHSLKAITYLWQHDFIEKAECGALTSPEGILQIGKSLKDLPLAGYEGRSGVSGQGVFLAHLKNSALLTCAEHTRLLAGAKFDTSLDTKAPPTSFAEQGALKAVTVTFEAATRFKRSVPLCQLQILARDVGALAAEAAHKNIPSLLSSSVVAMGALMAAHKGVRPPIFKEAVTEGFLVNAFEKVAKPVLQYPTSVEAKNVMRFFSELDNRRLLPDSITPAVRTYKALKRKAEGFV